MSRKHTFKHTFTLYAVFVCGTLVCVHYCKMYNAHTCVLYTRCYILIIIYTFGRLKVNTWSFKNTIRLDIVALHIISYQEIFGDIVEKVLSRVQKGNTKNWEAETNTCKKSQQENKHAIPISLYMYSKSPIPRKLVDGKFENFVLLFLELSRFYRFSYCTSSNTHLIFRFQMKGTPQHSTVRGQWAVDFISYHCSK